MGEGIQNGSHALRRNQLDLGTYLYSKSFAFVKKWSESLLEKGVNHSNFFDIVWILVYF